MEETFRSIIFDNKLMTCIYLRKCFERISNVFSNRLVISACLGYILIEYVECKHCTYTYDSGHVKHFFCSAYEYCCGPLCCRSRSIGFFQLWYFWLMIILMLMLCSGGGWWYKFRYRNHYRHGIPQLGIPNSAPGPRPFTYGQGMQTIGQQAPPPYPTGISGAYPIGNPYPAGMAGPYPPNFGACQYPPSMATPVYPQANLGGAYPLTGGTPYPAQPMGPMPPPPYAGPPPSYAAATGGMPS